MTSLIWNRESEELVLASGDRVRLDTATGTFKGGVRQFKNVKIEDIRDCLHSVVDLHFSFYGGRSNAELVLVDEIFDRDFAIREAVDARELTDRYYEMQIYTYDASAPAGESWTIGFSIARPIATRTNELARRLSRVLSLFGVDFERVRWSVGDEGESVASVEVLPPVSWLVSTLADFVAICIDVATTRRLDVSQPNGLMALLLRGHGRLLLGLEESAWFDAKEVPYRLDDELQRYEMALDVAAFANTGEGGVVAIGLATKRNWAGIDVVSKVRGVRGRIDLDRYAQVLNDRIVPPVEGLRIVLLAVDNEEVLVILIPKQSPESQPRVVKGGDVGREKVVGSMVSIPVRRGDRKAFMSPEQIHSLLVAGSVAMRNPSDLR